MAQLNITSTAPRVEVRQITSAVGAGVFAVGDLSPGDAVIAIENPLFVALDAERLSDTCYECCRREGEIPIEMQLGYPPCPVLWATRDSSEVTLKACAGCRTVKYCSKACQKSSWTAHHSSECSIFKTWYPQRLPNHIRAVLRVLLLRHKGRIGQGDWDAFMACMSHSRDLEEGGEGAILDRMARATKKLLSFDIQEELIREALMRLKVNSITLQSPIHEPLGLALHPLVAMVNHSCDPNCYVRCLEPNNLQKGAKGANPGSIMLTPCRNIKAGDQITIPYVDEKMPVSFRKRELKERYFFNCDCIACTTQEQDTSTAVRNRDARTKSALETIRFDAKAYFDGIRRREQTTSPQDRIKDLVTQIRTLFIHDPGWDLGLYPFPQLLHQLILTHIDSQKFVSAFRLAALLHFNVDPKVDPSDVHPMRLIHTLLVIKLLGTLLDQMLPVTISPDPDLQRLANEIDLDYWNRTLVEQMAVTANKTWTELPWPWLYDTVRQRGTQSPAASKSTSEARSGYELKRMEALCSRALEPLKHA